MTSPNLQMFNDQPLPTGERIIFTRSRPIAPDRPIIPYIEGDGAGPSTWRATRRTIDSAVHKAYGPVRAISWYEVFAGQKARNDFSEWLPDGTIGAIRHLGICMVGSLFEPVATGVRNKLAKSVSLPHRLRPVTGLPGWPTPMQLEGIPKMLILSDVAALGGTSIDVEADQPEAATLASVMEKLAQPVPPGTVFSINTYSKDHVASLLRRAVALATSSKISYLTIVHRGEPGRTAENWFKEWTYSFLEDQFRQTAVTQRILDTEHGGVLPDGALLVRDMGLHAFLSEFTQKPQEHHVVVCPANLSEPLAVSLNAQLAMTKLSPQALIGDECAVFIASSLSTDSREKMDLANPMSLLLSGILMLDFLGWREAADLLYYGLAKAIDKKLVTYDLEELFSGATKIKTSDFATVIIDNIVKR